MSRQIADRGHSQTQYESVIGIYPDLPAAEGGVAALQAGDIPADQISLLGPSWRDDRPIPGLSVEFDHTMLEGAELGLGLGAALGALVGIAFLWIPIVGPVVAIGPLAAALVGLIGGAVEGAAAGAALGVLAGWSVSEIHIGRYEQALRAGHFLVIAQGRPAEIAQAQAILQGTAATDVTIHQQSFSAPRL